MMNPKEVPLYKGFVKIFFFFLLAMVGGFLGGELRALKADALTSSVPPPPLRAPHKGPGSLLWRSPRAEPTPQKLAILPDVEEQEHDETGGGEGEGEAPDMAGLKAMMQGMGGMGGMGGGAGGAGGMRMGYVSFDVDVG